MLWTPNPKTIEPVKVCPRCDRLIVRQHQIARRSDMRRYLSLHRICCCGGMNCYACTFGTTSPDGYTALKIVDGAVVSGVNMLTIASPTATYSGAYGIAVDPTSGYVWAGRDKQSGTSNVGKTVFQVDDSWSLQTSTNLYVYTSDFMIYTQMGRSDSDSSGNVYVPNSRQPSAEAGVVAVASFDSGGSNNWTTDLDPADDLYQSFKCVHSGSHVWVAARDSGGTYARHLWKLSDPDGSVSWYSDGGWSAGFSVANTGLSVDSSGNAYMASTVAAKSSGGGNANVTKTNTSGTVQWAVNIGSSFTGRACAIIDGGNLWVGGTVDGSGYNLFEVNPSTGSVVNSYTVASGSTIYCMESDPSGNIYAGNGNGVILVDTSDGSVLESVNLSTIVLDLARCGLSDSW